jgi:serine/threonine-protein kinase ULK/ATG1
MADFGFATELGEDEMIKFFCGTPLSMAPEILNDDFYNHKADIWSCGIALYEALFRTSPFSGEDQKELIKSVNNGII